MSDKQNESSQKRGQENDTKVDAGAENWRAKLSPEEYHVLREKGTERPYTGEYWNLFDEGTYSCRGCGESLFTSGTKFESHCGWPSFYEAMDPAKIQEVEDTTYGMRRVEVTCKSCGGHLGHVFPDGPRPTGMRYCINSVSLRFQPRGSTDAGSPDGGLSEKNE